MAVAENSADQSYSVQTHKTNFQHKFANTSKVEMSLNRKAIMILEKDMDGFYAVYRVTEKNIELVAEKCVMALISDDGQNIAYVKNDETGEIIVTTEGSQFGPFESIVMLHRYDRKRGLIYITKEEYTHFLMHNGDSVAEFLPKPDAEIKLFSDNKNSKTTIIYKIPEDRFNSPDYGVIEYDSFARHSNIRYSFNDGIGFDRKS